MCKAGLRLIQNDEVHKLYGARPPSMFATFSGNEVHKLYRCRHVCRESDKNNFIKVGPHIASAGVADLWTCTFRSPVDLR
mmetsp:Transcript_65257/g.120151  ORF Transcript_65257/g.120151 Transcript_65257/m.120151 type:complete len:80 (+) Transcript_65257:105-344(+)